MTENPEDIRKLKALADISLELNEAIRYFPPFHSCHEGYAIIKEELDELWEEIKKRVHTYEPVSPEIKKEAIQTAAMAVRFIMDLCEE
jgi:archaellum component FlaC